MWLAAWDVREQKLLAELVDLAAIGVSVTEAGVLVPEKSVSLLVELGPGYEARKVQSPCCLYCDQNAHCRWRH